MPDGETVRRQQDRQPQKRSCVWRNPNLASSATAAAPFPLPPLRADNDDGDVQSGTEHLPPPSPSSLVTHNDEDCGKKRVIFGDEGSPPATHSGSIDGKRNIIPCGNGEAFDRGSLPRPSLPITGDGTSKKMICCKGDVSRSGGLSSSVTTLGIGGGGYQKAINGIALPSGCDKLLSASADGTVRICDCHNRRCVQAIDLGGPISCIITQGHWVFAGARGAVHCCHVWTRGGFTLPVPTGLVCSLVATHDALFAGVEDGSILAWKMVHDDAGNKESYCFQPAGAMRGHTSAVFSLALGHGMLYSGSMDGTITAWHLDTLQRAHAVSAHTDAIMSLVCWGEFLLSSSVDGRITVWAFTVQEEGGALKAMHTQQEEMLVGDAKIMGT